MFENRTLKSYKLVNKNIKSITLCNKFIVTQGILCIICDTHGIPCSILIKYINTITFQNVLIMYLLSKCCFRKFSKTMFLEKLQFLLNVKFQDMSLYVILMKIVFLLNFENPTFLENSEN